jgi:hypothetical protein
MVKIQLDLSEQEDRLVELYKVVNGMKSKEDAIKAMIRFFRVNITPKNVDKNDVFYKNALKFDSKGD